MQFYQLTSCDNTQPSRIVLDFEHAAVNALTSAFPESSIKGCYFHLCQAFLRKVNELGLKKAYEIKCELSLALRVIPALSFVPTDLVEQSFESLIEEIEHVVDRLDLEQSLSDKIGELSSYFHRSYIKGEKAGNRCSLWVSGTIPKKQRKAWYKRQTPLKGGTLEGHFFSRKPPEPLPFPE